MKVSLEDKIMYNKGCLVSTAVARSQASSVVVLKVPAFWSSSFAGWRVMLRVLQRTFVILTTNLHTQTNQPCDFDVTEPCRRALMHLVEALQ